jgi:hypothetical protein
LKILDNAQITSKAVEISKSLVGTAPGMFTHDLGVTGTIGDAARLALTIRQRGVEISRETLAAVSAALKIDSRLTESDLVPLFEDLGWWEVKRRGTKLLGVVERVPPVEDVLGILGQEWWNRGPTQVDTASVKALSLLATRPYERQALLSEIEVDDSFLASALEYGEQAQYLGKFASIETGSEIIWSPLYWANNADKVRRFLEKQNEPKFVSISKLAAEFTRYPGRPVDQIDSSQQSLLDAGIWHGFFPTSKVKDRQKKDYEYAFASSPVFGTDPKSDIFEKARMIVSCIRHGQYHAEISTIKYPFFILRAMRTNQMKPHSYANIQYAILGLNKIVGFERAHMGYGTSWKIVFNDTPENQLAADVAEQMLRGEQPVPVATEEAEARKVLTQGMYGYAAEQRRIKTGRTILAKNEYDRLLELVGVLGK